MRAGEQSFLFLFVDGVGLGQDDPQVNPLARADLPYLHALLGGKRLVQASLPVETGRATLLSLDATLGVPGLPQSATGQAALLTGQNVPAALGYHYGPKPDPGVAEFLRNGNLFSRLKAAGLNAALLNAYPPGYFAAIASGRRLHAAVPLAVTSAGLALKTAADLYAGQALSADFTAQGWHDTLGLTDVPLLSASQAGSRLAELAQDLDFAFFEYWLSDYAGHDQDMETALRLLKGFDETCGALLDHWDDRRGLVLITSDHGNLENLSTHRHTTNPVPALVVGALPLRQDFTRGLRTLADVAPAILRFLLG